MAETVSEAVINQIAETIGATSKEKGFWEDPLHPLLARLNTKLLLIVSEVIEAAEILRAGRVPEDVSPTFAGDLSLYQAEQFFEELADIIIRALDISGYIGWDIGETLLSKVEKNRHRPYRHGKAF